MSTSKVSKMTLFIQKQLNSVRWWSMLMFLIFNSLGWVMIYIFITFEKIVTDGRKESTYQSKLISLSNFTDKRNLAEISKIMDLAVEFHFDPTIVMIVDHYSRLNVDQKKLAWSMVKDHEVVTHITLSLIKIESNGNTFATSKKKAYGLTQLLLPTARDYEPEVTMAQLYDQETNIRIFFMHFERLLNHYEGNITKAIHAWNRGEGTVNKLLARNIDPANGFSASLYRVALTNNRGRISFR